MNYVLSINGFDMQKKKFSARFDLLFFESVLLTLLGREITEQKYCLTSTRTIFIYIRGHQYLALQSISKYNFHKFSRSCYIFETFS